MGVGDRIQGLALERFVFCFVFGLLLPDLKEEQGGVWCGCGGLLVKQLNRASSVTMGKVVSLWFCVMWTDHCLLILQFYLT